MDVSWMNHPALGKIDKQKLEMLQNFAQQGMGKEQNALLPFLMQVSKKSQKSGNLFTKEEMNTIIEILKEGKSKKEIEKMDRMISIMNQIKK